MNRRMMAGHRNIETMTGTRAHWPLLILVAAIIWTISCGSREDRQEAARRTAAARPERGGASEPNNAPQSTARSAHPGAPRIVILGDSLTAGLGLPVEQSYPALIQQRLDRQGLTFEVVNAGVSGDTSAGGLSRLDWALEGNVRVLIVALGGNDGLRGLPPAQLKANLAQIIEQAQGRRIRVILAGMEAPPNYGRDYIVAFHKVYPALAKEYKVPFLPFLLDGVAGSETLNQPDGIHPTAEGARIMADHVWTVLKPVLDDVKSQASRFKSQDSKSKP
jgi:acyl-CoA thioesterase-1